MGPTTVIAGVLPELQELLDIDMPGFKVGTDGPQTLAALIDGDSRVVGNLEEGHHPL